MALMFSWAAFGAEDETAAVTDLFTQPPDVCLHFLDGPLDAHSPMRPAWSPMILLTLQGSVVPSHEAITLPIGKSLK